MSQGQKQCPICEHHGFESYIIPPAKSCSRMKHKFHTENGLVPIDPIVDYARFITCFWNGKWRTYDKYDYTVYDKPTLMRLEQEQRLLLINQVESTHIVWQLCAREIKFPKRVIDRVHAMLAIPPYAPVYTCYTEQFNLFRALLGCCCSKRQKNQ